MPAPAGVGSLAGASVFAICETTATLVMPSNTVNRVLIGSTLLVACMLPDMGKLDPDDSRPPYRQIADTLRSAIEAGELAPGDRLPALPALMSEYSVSLGTVRSALAALRDDGLVVTRQGKGSYVRTHREQGFDSDHELRDLRRAVEALASRLAIVEQKLTALAGDPSSSPPVSG